MPNEVLPLMKLYYATVIILLTSIALLLISLSLITSEIRKEVVKISNTLNQDYEIEK